MKGRLPWQGSFGIRNKKKLYEKWLDVKKETSTTKLTEGLPKCFATYLDYCKNLKFEEEPDYEYLIGLFDLEKSAEEVRLLEEEKIEREKMLAAEEERQKAKKLLDEKKTLEEEMTKICSLWKNITTNEEGTVNPDQPNFDLINELRGMMDRKDKLEESIKSMQGKTFKN